MTVAKSFLSFEAYLAYDDGTDQRYELIDGELVALSPESGLNTTIAHYLFLRLSNAGIPFERVKLYQCEIQVPVLQRGDAQNRYPDLVVLREEHTDLVFSPQRLTILIDRVPPMLVVEVVSPGKVNRDRDLNRKVAQYARRGIPEYWIIDPEYQSVTVLWLENESYQPIGVFQGDDRLQSPTFPDLDLTAHQILSAGQK